MSELDITKISDSTTGFVDPSGGTIFGGSFTFAIQPKSTIMRYTSPTGKCYVGDFSSSFSQLQEV